MLARISQTNPTVLAAADAASLEQQKLGLHSGTVQSGCTADTVGNTAFFCDYVMHTLLLDTQLGSTTEARAKLLATGGLKIYTTVSEKDQASATKAVNWVLPSNSQTYNPAHNAATEVLIQPGTGKVLAIAEDRHYGTGPGRDRGRLRGQHPVRRRRGRADRIVVQAVHPHHRPRAGRTVRLPAHRPRQRHGERLLPTARGDGHAACSP